jgi:outer membrane protein TolC
MKQKLAFFLFCLIFAQCLYAQKAGVEKWTLSECLSYGLKNHPMVKIARSNIDADKAQLKQTRAYWDPKIGFRAGWNRRKSDSGYSPDPMVDSTNESVSVSKVLLDSGQNLYSEKAVKSSIAAAHDRFNNTLLELAASIKKSFFLAQQAQALIEVRQDTLDGYIRHVEKVEGFVEVGSRPPYDITRARVDVANARVELISANSRFRVARANLARAIGLSEELDIADFTIEKLPGMKVSKEELSASAFSRPELLAAQKEIEAVKARIQSIKRSLKPVVSASADYSWSGTSTPMNRQWTAGVTLNWSVFDGALTDSRVDSARTQLVNADENYRNLQLQVNTELENALTDLADALERFKATEILVQQASESMELAEGRYYAGLGSPIEINDARVEYTRARGNHIVSYYDSLISMAELERVSGKLPIEFQIEPLDGVSSKENSQ